MKKTIYICNQNLEVPIIAKELEIWHEGCRVCLWKFLTCNLFLLFLLLITCREFFVFENVKLLCDIYNLKENFNSFLKD